MSGPNGDPNISMEDGIINDDDEFDDEGTDPMSSFIIVEANDAALLCIATQTIV